ncbi:hypothetical protein ACNSOL_12285 (plasmid) [Aliarcobacter lanthieri]|uniref:hypothetical protein n=1 Tax=Aliarcobacter lanthieri TaxID=1355374 RepID=UPI003AAB3519
MMSKLINVQELLKVIGAKDKEEIESTLDNSSPSLVEYLLRQSVEYSEEIYIKASNIEKKLSIGNIDIIFDYEKECYIVDNGFDPSGDLL